MEFWSKMSASSTNRVNSCYNKTAGGIIFEERDEDDKEFCGVYMVVKQAKIIFVNTNLRTSRKHFTIAHELGHHYLGHPLHNGAIICDSDSVFGKISRNKKRSRLLCSLLPDAGKYGQTKADRVF